VVAQPTFGQLLPVKSFASLKILASHVVPTYESGHLGESLSLLFAPSTTTQYEAGLKAVQSCPVDISHL